MMESWTGTSDRSPSTSPIKRTRTPWPWWMSGMIGVAVVIGVLAGVTHVLGSIGQRRWERQIERLRDRGELVTMDDVINARSVIPPERNSAMLLVRLGPELEGLIQEAGERDPDAPGRTWGSVFNWRGRGPDVFDPVPRAGLEWSRALLERHGHLWEELRKLSDMPSGRFELDVGGGWPFLAKSTLDRLVGAGGYLKLRAAVDLCDGNVSRAVECLILLMRIAAATDEIPSSMGRFAQIWSEGDAIRLIESILKTTVPDSTTLDRIDQALVERRSGITLRWALCGERALMVHQFDTFGKTGTPGMFAGPWTGAVATSPESWAPVVFIRANQMVAVRMISEILEAREELRAIRVAVGDYESRRKTLPFYHSLSRLLLPHFGSLAHRHVLSGVRMDAARVMIAVERFRMDHEAFPSTLEELVPKHLDRIPEDPYSDGPLRMSSANGGVVIYSVGPNETDDGGDVVSLERRGRPLDAGVRLFPPSLRGVRIEDRSPALDP